MNENNNLKLVLDGLCCSNCAMKIEKRVSELKTVKNASLNFATKLMIVEAEKEDTRDVILEDIKRIVKAVEPDVTVREKKTKRNTMHTGINGYNKEHRHGEKHDPTREECVDGCDCCSENSHTEDDSFIKNKLIQFGIAAVLFAAALIIDFPNWLKVTLFFASYLIAGGEVLLLAIRNIQKGDIFDENFLMCIATIGAFAIGEFPEGVAVMLFYQIGEMFQGIAVNRSRKSIADLMDIRPDYANLKVGSDMKTVTPEEVRIGELIIVKPGEKVPLDGKVVEGSSMVDTSALTGESVPREITVDDSVLGGFINKNGLLTIEVIREFEESTVAKILDMVQNASSRKAPTENFITKFARKYTPAVTIAAFLLAVVPPIVIPGAVFSDWLYRALIFLVISCPCALVVSIPLGFFGGIGGASKQGVLVKGSNYLEALNYVDTIVFDKTGTLTKGVFKVTKINPAGKTTEEELLSYAAYAESFSNHPIAISILKAYNNTMDKSIIENFEELPGLGIRITLKGDTVLAGNDKLMNQYGIPYEQADSIGSAVYVAAGNKYLGNIIISDELKEDSEKALKTLKSMGIKKLVMLTGDSKAVGQKIGEKLGMDEIQTELLPHEKVHNLELLDKQKGTKGKLVFVGDGINDAPVLARADIGVAMGGLGSDAAIEAADVVLMTDEPAKLVTAIKIAKKTHTIVWQNIIFALGIKIVVLMLGAGGLATMWEAVFADVGVALIAVLNAMRAMKVE
ncbi:heavy metal translocating P-type ATPase [Anaerocolumna sp. MB42-C2]|uniref:heavy metal translocating P-type ATPase n=1 Tax=Anaerocolumna sp. MB42-C2 TaxID=3070997 RepID=UPI0027DFF8A1|nr:heavy metal translocating P-type ATPase [Anaerocolumna sp. MB42-C2]WMJ90494.1 heavy metal translocating P-type ATPase [Anaerocolumna sp. MB42-C2]